MGFLFFRRICKGIVSLPSPKPGWRYLLLPACLSPGLNCLCAGFWTTRLGAGISNQVPLPVQAGNEHGPAVVIAAWLVGRDIRRFSPFWCDISQALAEAAAAKLRCAPEEFNRIICTEGGGRRLHCAVMFIAQRENVGPHRLSLASQRQLSRAAQ